MSCHQASLASMGAGMCSIASVRLLLRCRWLRQTLQTAAAADASHLLDINVHQTKAMSRSHSLASLSKVQPREMSAGASRTVLRRLMLHLPCMLAHHVLAVLPAVIIPVRRSAKAYLSGSAIGSGQGVNGLGP